MKKTIITKNVQSASLRSFVCFESVCHLWTGIMCCASLLNVHVSCRLEYKVPQFLAPPPSPSIQIKLGGPSLLRDSLRYSVE